MNTADIHAIIDRIIQREGGYGNDAVDRGGATKFGVTALTLGAWRKLGRPATPEEVKHLSVHEARDIYTAWYVVEPGFTAITDAKLAETVIDAAVNLGPRTATRQLQTALGVSADGRWGPVTEAAVSACDSAAINTALVKSRCLHYGRIVQADPAQAKFLPGWLSRALELL